MTEHEPRQEASGHSVAFALLLTACVVGMGMLIPAGFREAAEAPLEFVVWVLFIGASNLLSLPALPRIELDVSVGAPVVIAAVVLLEPPLAALINFAGLTNEREFKGTAPLEMSVFNRCQVGLSAGFAGWVVHSQASLGVIGRTIVAVLVYNVANTLFVGLATWARKRLSVVSAARQTAAPFPRFALDFGIVTMLALYIVIAYDSAGAFAAALLALPLWLGFSALRSSRAAEDRAEELADRVRELETLNAAATEFLAARTRPHAVRVATGALERALGTDQVVVALDGDLGEGVMTPEEAAVPAVGAPADGDPEEVGPTVLRTVPIPGNEPGVIGVPEGVEERSFAVVEAIAGLFGMTLVRQQLESDLAEVQRARAALSERILEEGTRERSRIALEIHDDVLPSLAAAQIQADNVRSALAAGALDRAGQIAKATYEAAHAAIARLREVLDDLHRQILVPGALRPHLLDALHEVKLHHGVEGVLHAPEDLPGVPHAVEILVLETVRGCLANVARHAAATCVEVGVTLSERALAFEVRDDGRGFDPTAVAHGHHGLALMAQRVELARGRFRVDSAPDAGTRVHVEVPL